MAVGLQMPGPLLPIKGIQLGVAAAGIRYRGRNDLLVIAADVGTQGAAVFTRNAFCAAPVQLARDHLAEMAPRFLLVNAGNANAGTGEPGLAAAHETCRLLAERGGCEVEAVLPFSTGVIGEPLPVARFPAGIASALQGLHEDGWLEAAQTIMTTDTLPKGASRQFVIDGRTVTLTGIVKGSGMIHPDMATLLVFIGTDASVPGPVLRQALNAAMAGSFNSITVDGDTSTNDACTLLATGASGVEIDDAAMPAYRRFADALADLCRELAQAVIRDGEGATKFVTIEVSGAYSVEEARQVAFTVANSPLVKTALFASDPNWGRILAAVGRSGIRDLDTHHVDLDINGVRIVTGGGRDPAYTEAQGQAALAQEALLIRIALSRGEASTQIWTTDLSYDYVRINADYRS
ncbi:bifunctional ornithine acetyltransferase/N-acetylglutamate synthase [Acidihalobacter yilgarnensis]|uniref:Arginine biosynthesis bifunctional protein ArgJ n=1 Tax=Acidihalobacter yilgarnensis TaxID=2819280 RepID=A0A1D8IR92_9GAMM|nr:bifunctional glutamate N-acetyltransferase/amino-acid acetyltransferase ArgJ [Acidihalobacter yilgarnensis]AOU99000.1 bifunctional ornithine acetyltransferase/N-acetylglutamate synthase [Acidihalobacter yilgarnensis]